MAFFGRPPVDSSKTNGLVDSVLVAKEVYLRKFILRDGSQADTWVLTSDAEGNGIWEPNPANEARTIVIDSTVNVGTAATSFNFPTTVAPTDVLPRGQIIVSGNKVSVNIVIYHIVHGATIVNGLLVSQPIVTLPTALHPSVARPSALVIECSCVQSPPQIAVATASISTSGVVTLDNFGSYNVNSVAATTDPFGDPAVNMFRLTGEYALTDPVA